jgi:hypothetical protein
MKMNNVDGDKVYVKLWTYSQIESKNAGIETLSLKDSPKLVSKSKSLNVFFIIVPILY